MEDLYGGPMWRTYVEESAAKFGWRPANRSSWKLSDGSGCCFCLGLGRCFRLHCCSHKALRIPSLPGSLATTLAMSCASPFFANRLRHYYETWVRLAASC